MGLHKILDLGVGQTRLELRVEAFNILNKTNLGSPNGNRSDANFGTIRTLATFPRQIPLGVKLDF